MTCHSSSDPEHEIGNRTVQFSILKYNLLTKVNGLMRNFI